MAPEVEPSPEQERPPRVLMVDDRPENLIALEAVLEPLGYSIVKAASGTEALHDLLEEEFSAIILDVQMPEMDGFETAALLKSRVATRHVPLIFLTAINQEFEHQLRGYNLGAVDYITKPFNPNILRAKLAVLVELSAEMRALARANAVYRESGAVVSAEMAVSRGPESQFEAPGADFVGLRRVLDLELDATLAAASIARASVRKELAFLDEDVLEDLVLTVSELVGNAVIHAKSVASIRIDAGPTMLRGEVTDTGARAPTMRETGADDPDGRGISIVQRITDRCGWTRLADGKSVWFEIDLEGAIP